jgi:uncharacterized membrane protein
MAHSGRSNRGIVERRYTWALVGAFLGISGLILALTPGAVDLGPLLRARPHAPDVAALASVGVLVRLHVATVVFALVSGAVLLAGPKGVRAHRVLGWSWVVSMGATAITSVFIRDMNHGSFSPIHIFSLMTLIALPIGVFLALTHRRLPHAGAMIGTYIGLIIAGITAVAPGRLLWVMFFD